MNTHTPQTVIEQDDLSICPSFSCYSSNRLSQTAIKVASEHNDEDEFEFNSIEFSAEQLLNSAQIGPVFPVFNQNLDQLTAESSTSPVPLSQLFLEDREEYDPPSCSSSDADESENIPASPYSIWRPKPIFEPSPSPATPSRCNKSKSTGSVSKRWKFRDLLLMRSNSEGKDSFVFLAPKQQQKKISYQVKGKTVKSQSPQYEALYVRNRAATEGNKKKSYLPYRKDLVGFFANVNGLRKSFPHF